MSEVKRAIAGFNMIAGVWLLTGCSLPFDGGSASDHPLPTTASILPLQIDNQWMYRYTHFDSTGTIDLVSEDDRGLSLEITGAYYLRDGGELVPVPPYDHDVDTVSRLVYRYEWESLDEGYLVFHQGTGGVARRGLYIAGTFSGTSTVLLDTARLWFAYPAQPRGAWQLVMPNSNGDTALSTIECVATTYPGWFMQPEYDSPLPIHILDSCYLYRQVVGDHVFYHTFHPVYGKLGMRHYYLGKLRESYLLVAANLRP